MKLKSGKPKKKVLNYIQAIIVCAVVAGGIAVFTNSSPQATTQLTSATQTTVSHSPVQQSVSSGTKSNLSILKNVPQRTLSMLKTGVVRNVKPGTVILSQDASDMAKDYTIKIGKNISTINLQIWDYAAEDGDYVQILQNGVPVTEVFMIKNTPVNVAVPAGGIVEVKGIRDGGGGITYAIFNPETGNTYFNRAPDDGSNKYTIVKE